MKFRALQSGSRFPASPASQLAGFSSSNILRGRRSQKLQWYVHRALLVLEAATGACMLWGVDIVPLAHEGVNGLMIFICKRDCAMVAKCCDSCSNLEEYLAGAAVPSYCRAASKGRCRWPIHYRTKEKENKGKYRLGRARPVVLTLLPQGLLAFPVLVSSQPCHLRRGPTPRLSFLPRTLPLP